MRHLRKLPIILIFGLELSLAQQSGCKDETQDCCMYHYTGEPGDSSLFCDLLISESSTTWKGTSSHTLTCQNEDSAANSECTWTTPKGTKCSYKLSANQEDVNEECSDSSISFTGDLTDNTALCQIRVSSPDPDKHDGQWTCAYQTYRDYITVKVQSGV